MCLCDRIRTMVGKYLRTIQTAVPEAKHGLYTKYFANTLDWKCHAPKQ